MTEKELAEFSEVCESCLSSCLPTNPMLRWFAEQGVELAAQVRGLQAQISDMHEAIEEVGPDAIPTDCLPLKEKDGKTRVDVEYLRNLQAQRSAVNKLDLHKIAWYENGKPRDVPKEWIDSYEFSGLDNCGFVRYVLDEPERICRLTFTRGEKP